MQAKDKINKYALSLLEGAIDNLQSDLVSAVNGGVLKIDKSSLPSLLTLVKSSLESGYHRGNKVFERSVQGALDEHLAANVVTTAAKKK